jgi:hypothetical protein
MAFSLLARGTFFANAFCSGKLTFFINVFVYSINTVLYVNTQSQMLG